jgi:Na+/proline symporter
MIKQTGFLFGVLGILVMLIASILLALQPQIALNTLMIAAVAPLAIILVFAGLVGWLSHRFNNNPTLNGALAGGLIALGSLLGNIIISSSHAYSQALNNLPQNQDVQLTGFNWSPSSIVTTFLVSILLGTISASLVAYISRRLLKSR